MGFVDIAPDSTIGGYPLLSSFTGAASRHAALSDSSDASYVYQETANTTDGIDILGFANPSVPAGAIVVRGEIHGRMAHALFNTLGSFQLQAPPKPQYVSPWSPDQYANVWTVLGTDAGTWHSAVSYDELPHDWGTFYGNTWLYNNGFGIVHLNWDQVDLTQVRILYYFHTTQTDVNRLHKLFIRVWYDQPPTVSGIQPTDLSAGQTFTTTPTITWTFADTDGAIQSQYRVIIVKSDALDAAGVAPGATGFNPETATKSYDSNVVAGASNTSTVGPLGLTNLSSYYAYVKVWHAPVLGKEMVSAWTASAVFQVNGTPPSVPTITTTVDDTNSRIIIEATSGSWTATPYTNYFNIFKLPVDLIGDLELVRNGVQVDGMTALRTGSDANNEIDTPHHSSLAITGDMELRACIALEGAVPSNGHYIISKWDAANGTAYLFRMLSTNALEFQWWNGSSLQVATSPSTITLPSAKTPFWVRVRHNTSSPWNAQFYYSFEPEDTDPNSVTWVSLGTHTGSGSGTKTSVSSELTINRSTTPQASVFRIYYAEVRNSANAIVANPDFRGALMGTTTLTDSTGKVWTIRRSGTVQNFPFVRIYDYEEAPGQSRIYTAQAVTVSAGSPVGTAHQGSFTTGLTTTTPYVWWFKVVLDPDLNHSYQLLPGSWDGTKPAEAAAFSPLGRTRKVVVSDGTRGHEGVVQVECLDVEDYEALLAIYEAQQVVFIQTYQHERYLAFLDWSDDRGTLAPGYSVVSLKVVEVDKPAIT